MDTKQLTVTQVSAPAARTSTVTGSAIDLKGYEGRVNITQCVGTVSGTSPTLDGKIQTSADGSTGWADVTGATYTQVTASTATESVGVDPRGVYRYIRYVGTIGGTSPSFGLAVVMDGLTQYRS